MVCGCSKEQAHENKRMREHDEANKILKMKTRQEQANYWKSLPEDIRAAVGDLVRIAKKAEDNRCYPGWRD